jgi:hypothetical protein
MYTTPPAACLTLGVQGTVLPLNDDPPNWTWPVSHGWDQPFPEMPIATHLDVGTTAFKIEKLLSSCFSWADPSNIKTAVCNLMDSVNAQNGHAYGQRARAPAPGFPRFAYKSVGVDTIFISSSSSSGQSETRPVDEEDAAYPYSPPS